ncbi:MAG: GNAT family N-acetyltransferase [Desulfobacterales bacterium]|nr:MAG: GNAT family N-acetyltransferase [Desulfobacterales bacterium]
MNIRQFKPDDAESCFRLRSNAFIQKFHHELSPQDIAFAVNAYMPDDYIRMAKEMPFFIVEHSDKIIGFFNLKQKDTTTAELQQIYIALDTLGKGIGSACIEYMEQWLSSNWKDVCTLIVETIIPQYNSEFYKKVGFEPIGDTFCEFLGHKIKALRLAKNLSC